MIRNLFLFILLWLSTLFISFNYILPHTGAYKTAIEQFEQTKAENPPDIPDLANQHQHGYAIGYIAFNRTGFMALFLLGHTLLIVVTMFIFARAHKRLAKSHWLGKPLESTKNILSTVILFTTGIFNYRAASQLRIYLDLPLRWRIMGLLAYVIVFLAITVSYNVPNLLQNWQFSLILYLQTAIMAILLWLPLFVKSFRPNYEKKLFWMSVTGLALIMVCSMLMGLQLARQGVPEFQPGITHQYFNFRTFFANLLVVLAFSFFIEMMKQIFTQKARTDAEMDVARRIQQKLLPELSLNDQHVELFGETRSANHVGGDYCDAISLPDGRYAVAIGDVSGHNVAAGVMMSMLKVAFRTELTYLNRPEDLAASLNRTIYDNKNKNMFTSFIVALLDPEQHSLTLLNCGHPPLLHYCSKEKMVKQYRTGDLALGLQRDVEFHAQDISCHPNDIFVLFSDGLTEANNLAGDELGLGPILDLLDHAHTRTAQDIYQQINQTVESFRGKQTQRDDETVIVFKIA